MRSSFKPYGFYYLAKAMAQIPKFMYIALTNDSSWKLGITFSNVAGPKTPIIYEGCMCSKLAILPPPVQDTCFGISVISVGGVLKSSIMTDDIVCSKPDEILDLFWSERIRVLNEFQNKF